MRRGGASQRARWSARDRVEVLAGGHGARRGAAGARRAGVTRTPATARTGWPPTGRSSTGTAPPRTAPCRVVLNNENCFFHHNENGLQGIAGAKLNFWPMEVFISSYRLDPVHMCHLIFICFYKNDGPGGLAENLHT